MQRKELYKKWINLIRPLFPNSARFRTYFKSRDYCIAIDWLLKTDLNRPRKKSKVIEITIREEFINDYLEKNADQRIKIDKGLAEFIKQKLSVFDPDHNKTRYQRRPVEEWLVSSIIDD